jgi:hypothetical protein
LSMRYGTSSISMSFSSLVDKLCSCNPKLIGELYTTCSSDHCDTCEYRRTLPAILSAATDISLSIEKLLKIQKIKPTISTGQRVS